MTSGPNAVSLENRDELCIPVLAPIGHDAALTCRLLREEDISCAVLHSPQELMQHLSQGSGPVVLAEEALSDEDARDLIAWLNAQPGWSELPLLIFAGRHSRPQRFKEFSERANIMILNRPIEPLTFLSVARAALESRRRQYQVRDLLAHLRALNRRLEERAGKLRQLAFALTEAEHRERLRLAQVLHDHLQQVLVAAKMSLNRLRADGDAMRADIAKVDSLLKDAIDSSRSLSYDLSPPVLHQVEFGACLEWLVREKRSKYGLIVSLHHDPAADSLPQALRDFFFRSAREMLFNVVKHAGVLRARLETRVEHGWLQLIVSDNGKGFDAAQLRQQGADAGGFGLFSIQERVSLLEGRLEIESEPGEGCRLTLYVPLKPAREASDRVAASKKARRGGKVARGVRPLRVLVAEDHRTVREGIVSLLEAETDIEVVGQAEDGRQALQQASTLRPDVVLMDVAMPGLDGIEATRQLRKDLPQVQVIGLSVFEEDSTAERMLDAGARAYLVKSGPVENLLSAIRACRKPVQQRSK